MSRRDAVLIVAVTLIVLCAVVADVTPLLRGPAPYPPEWQWALAPKAVSVRVIPALACLAGLLALLRWPGLAVIPAATILGWGLQLAILNLEPDGAAAELVRRTASGSFTSYHTVAAIGPGRDPGSFLARHHLLLPGLRKGTPHAATHPPGAVLLYRGLIDLCERVPALARMLSSVPGTDSSPGLLEAPRAAAVLGASLFGLLGALACWPVRTLAAALTDDRASSGRLAVLWTLVPGLVLMTPELDQALALPVAAAVACLAVAARIAAPGRATSLAAGAGALVGLALFFSYGAALLAAIGGAAALALVPRDRAVRLALATVAAAGIVFLLPHAVGHDPIASLRTGLALHGDQFTDRRSYLAWLVFNPWDLFLFLGPPVALLGLMRAGLALAALAQGRPVLLADRFAAVLLAALAVFILSGVVRGEMGRILLPLMPVLLVGALAGPRSPSSGESVLVGLLLFTIGVTLRLSWQLP